MDRKDSKMVVVRGAGDLATGTIHRLCRAGFNVLALETAHPLAIRRHVALSEAVVAGAAEVEGVRAVRVRSAEEARRVWEFRQDGEERTGRPETAATGRFSDRALRVPVMVDPDGRCIQELEPFAVVDAILAKRNLGTCRDMAPLTIAFGPGFTAGEDVDYVIETMRGHNLGRIIRAGQAAPDTGTPGIIGGYGAERVVHAPVSGILHIIKDIGDTVQAGEVIAVIRGSEAAVSEGGAEETMVRSQIPGLVRGMIREGTPVHKGLKIADVDPRTDQRRNCFTISDKARCIAGSVLELLCSASAQREKEPSGRVGCVLMAAGWSKRFGADKLLVPVGGKPLVTRIMSQLHRAAAQAQGAEPLVIARCEEIAALAKEYDLDCILYEGGTLSDTIRKALEAPGADRWIGCMFIPADQPLLTAQSMEMLLEAFLRSPEEIHRLCADRTPGNPVIFPASCFSALKDLQGDVGGRTVIRRGTVPVRMHEVRDCRELLDADSPQKLKQILEAMGRPQAN